MDTILEECVPLHAVNIGCNKVQINNTYDLRFIMTAFDLRSTLPSFY